MKRLLIILIGIILICGLASCESGKNESKSEKISEESYEKSAESTESEGKTEMSEEKSVSEISDEQSKEISEESENEIVIPSKNSEAFRLSSIYDTAKDSKTVTYKTFAPYTDKYNLTCPQAEAIEIMNSDGDTLASGKTDLSFEAEKGSIIYIYLELKENSIFSLEVSPENHAVELPYEINSSVDISTFSVYSDSDKSPLTPSAVTYTKRTDERAMYINCNNPEALSADNINTCLTVNNITEKDVFFTFEHNNASEPFYYGYRITNTGDGDLYVTVKNFGFQLDGDGCWLGEDEWIKFYNIEFKTDVSGLSSSQMKNFDAYIGFAMDYKSENRKPVTYRIPVGEYIYIMGGTTADAYMNINVFDSANKTVSGGCSNAAVIFSTYGSEAKGEFVVYNDAEKLNENILKSAQNGYVGNSKSGSQYVGYDDCHGVVDADLVWVFNDSTKSGDLGVTYKNPYYLKNSTKGERYAEIVDSAFSAKSFSNAKTWVTHINPNGTANAFGTDMTKYITVDSETKEEIVIDYLHYDGKGNTANIGNWMVDYIDTVTLVNQGDTDRTFTYKLKHNGVILAFVRDANGAVSETYTPSYCVNIADSSYGKAISRCFTYTVTVKAHSVLRFSVDYNLLANSNGHITHSATLQ